MKFDEFVEKYGENVDGLFKNRDILIEDVTRILHVRVHLRDVDTGIPLSPLDIWDATTLIGLLRTAEDQGVIDLDKIDIDPDNLIEAIRPLIGCTLQMPIRLDQL